MNQARVSPTTPRPHGRVALVTGGAAGIGRAVVERLARDGWSVTIADTDSVSGNETARRLTADGLSCRFEHVDIADVPARNRLVEIVIDTWGSIDLLVNNAATVGRRLGILELTEDDWDRVLATNLTAAVFLSRDAARAMSAAGSGVIINLAAIQEHLPLATHVSYVASKGGVSALTRALAVELGEFGIRVNAVVPGSIGTQGMAEERISAGIDPASGSLPLATLLPQAGSPRDVGAAVAFLASGEASFITGSTITVDGGRSISRKPDPLAAGMSSHKRPAWERDAPTSPRNPGGSPLS